MSPGSHVKFGLGTFSRKDSQPFAGLVLGSGRVVPVGDLRDLCEACGTALPDPTSTLSLLEAWPRTLPALQAAADAIARGDSAIARDLARHSTAIADLRVHPPVASRQVLMSGANYFKHVVDLIVDLGPGKTPGTEHMSADQLRAHAEALMHRRRKEGSPYFFCKPVSAMSGAYDPIVIAPGAEQTDWELELAVVIGTPARHVLRANALSHVAGYTIANDITDRDKVWAKGEMKPMGTDWIASKSAPSYLPVGPWIVPATHVGDPQQLRLQLKLNGETKQDESTADMIFDVARLIEHLSSQIQLLPGDLICTGSPAGNGTHYNRFLRPGDVIEASITGLGMQRTPVVAESR
jgi:2-keto-4-pentenoate hydratase/2-oxohepta-3-ene-1,7-dioic acid hydratase in catechol pathway